MTTAVPLSRQDLTGRVFGMLTALHRDGGDPQHPRWRFRCECSAEKTIQVHNVAGAGKIVSCGCFRLRRLAEAVRVDISGERFGRLVAVERVGRNPHGDSLWLCRCDCGTERTLPLMHLRRRKHPVRSCGCIRAEIEARNIGNTRAAEHARRQHVRRARARERGIITAEDEAAVLKLQRGRCAAPDCRSKLSIYHRDHIQPLSKGGRNERRNLQLLCPRCNLRKNSLEPVAWVQQMGLLI